MLKILIGSDDDRKNIIGRFPYTAQVIGEGGTLLTAKNEMDEIVGFLWSFCRNIPVPVDNLKEEFINVIEVFDEKDRCNGIGSALVQKCIEKAENDGVFQVRAYCDINNIVSHKLWVKNKFGISPVKMQNGKIAGSFVTFAINRNDKGMF